MQLQPSLGLTSQFGLLGCSIRDACPPSAPPPVSLPKLQDKTPIDRSKRLIY